MIERFSGNELAPEPPVLPLLTGWKRNGSVKSCSPPIVEMITVKMIVGRSSGTVICQNWRARDAPSMSRPSSLIEYDASPRRPLVAASKSWGPSPTSPSEPIQKLSLPGSTRRSAFSCFRSAAAASTGTSGAGGFKVGVVREGLIEYQRESMVLRYHYVVDLIAGATLALIAVRLAARRAAS